MDKAKQDVLSEAGRTDLKRQQVETDAAALEQRKADQRGVEAEWQNKEDARKLESARDNPEMLNVIQAERAVREQARQADERDRAFQAEKELNAGYLANAARVEIRQVATEAGIEADNLISLSNGDPEQAKRLAPWLPKLQPGNGAANSGAQPGPGSVPPTIRPDSAQTLGGEQPTVRTMIDRAKAK